MANSLAIMTDALHMLTDLVGILISLLALWLSAKPPTKRFTFGLHRLGKSPISHSPPTPPPLCCVGQLNTDGFNADGSCSKKNVCDQQCSKLDLILFYLIHIADLGMAALALVRSAYCFSLPY